VMELSTDLMLSLDPVGPAHAHSVACSTKMRGHLFGPLEWCVHRVRPPDWIVIVGPITAELIHHRKQEQKRFRLRRQLAHFVCRALQSAFTTRTVVAFDVEDQRV